MKKAVAIFLMITLMLSLVACGKEKGFEIPDVFGVNYTDATEVLEADGFEVTAIETSVGSISEKLLWPLENVDKGTVFKIDDYVKDGIGDLVKGSDDYYEGDLISNDKSIVIYYAKEDYVYDDGESEDDEISSTETITSSEESSSEQQSTNVSEESTIQTDDTSIDPDFKSAMDSYEQFMSDYVDFMKKYQSNPTDFSLLADYAKFMSDYADYMEDFEAWEDEDLNTAELAYYMDVQTRVTQKLLEVAQ